MPFVIFAAPLVSDNAFGMIEAIASLPDVRLGVVTHDPPEKLRHLEGRVAHWRITDILDVTQLVWAATCLAERNGTIHRFFGALEQAQVPLAEARAALGIEGMSVEAAMNFRDKARMKTLLRDAGLPCARHCLASTLEAGMSFGETNGFPIVVKPPAGAGAISTFRVDDMRQLGQALAMSPPSSTHPVLLEEFVQGEEHSFETMTVNGVHVWHSLTHYYPTPLTVLANPWIQWSVVLPREVDSPAYNDIRSAARRALDVLGMRNGITHMEWFRRADGTIAISEVAARPPGAQITQLMSYANDFDVLREWGRVMIFGEFTPPERTYAAGIAYLRGQGEGRIVAVHGVDLVNREFHELIVASRNPSIGASPSPSYEGDGWIIVRHPETSVVQHALQRIVSTMRVEVA